MPDDGPERAAGAVAGPENDRWHLEPYDPDVDDAPKGDTDDCNGRGDPVDQGDGDSGSEAEPDSDSGEGDG